MSGLRVAIVNYGMGNIGSVANSLRVLGSHFTVADTPQQLDSAGVYVLPGVGSFAVAANNLRDRGLAAALDRNVIEAGKPLLGICLGMQLLFTDSVEGGLTRGLDWIPGHVVPFEGTGIRVPHVGWNAPRPGLDGPVFSDIEPGAHFYFDHSYHVRCVPGAVTSTFAYGAETYVAAVRRGRVFGTQFHPEKSQRHGLKLLRSFLRYAERMSGAEQVSGAERVRSA